MIAGDRQPSQQRNAKELVPRPETHSPKISGLDFNRSPCAQADSCGLGRQGARTAENYLVIALRVPAHGTFGDIPSCSASSKGSPMELRNASEIRAQAERCLRRSQLADDNAAKLCWLSLAEGWQVLFDSGKAMFKEKFGDNRRLPSTRHPRTRH
jgi:hypothetical protein